MHQNNFPHNGMTSPPLNKRQLATRLVQNGNDKVQWAGDEMRTVTVVQLQQAFLRSAESSVGATVIV